MYLCTVALAVVLPCPRVRIQDNRLVPRRQSLHDLFDQQGVWKVRKGEWSLSQKQTVGLHLAEWKRMHKVDTRDWLRQFVETHFETQNGSALKSLKHKCARSLALYEAIHAKDENTLINIGKVGPGRGAAAGWWGRHVDSWHRRRLKGAGRKSLNDEVGFELYNWFLDTTQFLLSRLDKDIVLAQAEHYKKIVNKKYEKLGSKQKVGKLTSGWYARGLIEPPQLR